MFGIGVPELILILVVGLVIFGPGKLPELAATMGKGLREFKKATNALTQAINAPEQPKTQSQQPTAPANSVAAQPFPVSETVKQDEKTEETTVQQPNAETEAAPKEPEKPAYQPPTQDSVRQKIEAQQAEKTEKKEG